MSAAGGVEVRDRLFDELERLDLEEDRIRSRRTEVRNTLRVLHELGVIDLDDDDDSDGGNGRRPTSEADSEAPEPRAAPDPPPAEEEAAEPETFPCEHPGCSYVGGTQAQLNGHQSAHRSDPPKKRRPKRSGKLVCPSCELEFASRALAIHISGAHSLPHGKQFNCDAFDMRLRDANMSSDEVAERLEEAVGVAPGPTTIDNWRRGRSQPGLPFVEALAQILGVKTGELVWRRK